jgi:hypothetical protein
VDEKESKHVTPLLPATAGFARLSAAKQLMHVTISRAQRSSRIVCAQLRDREKPPSARS